MSDEAVRSLVDDIQSLISLSDLREAVRRSGGSYALEALEPMPPGKFWWQDYGKDGSAWEGVVVFCRPGDEAAVRALVDDLLRGKSAGGEALPR